MSYWHGAAHLAWVAGPSDTTTARVRPVDTLPRVGAPLTRARPHDPIPTFPCEGKGLWMRFTRALNGTDVGTTGLCPAHAQDASAERRCLLGEVGTGVALRESVAEMAIATNRVVRGEFPEEHSPD